MNRFLFAFFNFKDKMQKTFVTPELVGFYLNTYVYSLFRKKKPDFYIVSYPKCGRTWLRVMLQKYFNYMGFSISRSKESTIVELPDGRTIKFEHDQGSWVPAPPLIRNLKFKTSKYIGKKVVFLVRDPRDVLVSSWYHLKYRENIYRKNLDSFIRDELVGIRKVVSFMNMWCDYREIPDDFLLLYYENLHKKTEASFKSLLLFFNIPVNEKGITNVVKECSFEKMKKSEKQGAYEDPWMKPGKKMDNNSMKIRKGKIGGFKEDLSEEDVEYIDNIIHSQLNKYLSYSKA